MLTLKLVNGHTIKIVEATEVNVYRCGPENKLREVAIKTYGNGSAAFYVADLSSGLPDDHFGFAPEVDFWECAYVENAHGATTEKIRAY